MTPWTVAHQAPLSMEFSGKNTGVGSDSLLQGIFLTQELNLSLLHCRQILYHLSHQGYPGGRVERNIMLKFSLIKHNPEMTPLNPQILETNDYSQILANTHYLPAFKKYLLILGCTRSPLLHVGFLQFLQVGAALHCSALAFCCGGFFRWRT